ncbi:MAG: hypothetical protein ACLSAF_01500 [Intestinimonas sp.]
MWVMTLAAVLWLRKKYPDLHRPVYMPGGRPMAAFGIAALFVSLRKHSPPLLPRGAWHIEYGVAAALAVVGALLYHHRDRMVTDALRASSMFGGLLTRKP